MTEDVEKNEPHDRGCREEPRVAALRSAYLRGFVVTDARWDGRGLGFALAGALCCGLRGAVT